MGGEFAMHIMGCEIADRSEDEAEQCDPWIAHINGNPGGEIGIPPTLYKILCGSSTGNPTIRVCPTPT
jgi:hypothetical protein